MQLVSFLVLLVLANAQSYRLPTIYSPSLYTVNLTVPDEVFTTENGSSYTGRVAIDLSTTQNTMEIVLHASADYLNVTNVSISGDMAVSNYSVNSTTDIFTVTLNGTMVAGENYTVTIDFDGQLSTTDMYGFYKSSYNDSTTNETVYLATTQFESTYARRAFPCFDEPSYKANFSVSLTYPIGLNALGNMDVLSESSTDNTTTTVFKTSPVMSSYLIAFIISSFTCSTGDSIEESLPYQVCSRNETTSHRSLALEVAPLVIDSLNAYLNINYSLNMNKLDQVAIPDFSAGAMENWGLITYRERGLLYDEVETSNIYRQYITSVIAHELAHQWFGNLVTCNWWSEIFLNEGFATFFEYFTTHEIYPDMEMDKQFVTKTLQYIFEEDASSTEALRTNASTPSEISARFGGITYDKGGSILRMVEHIIGTETWKIALNNYLNTYAYSTSVPDNLWDILGTNISTTLPSANLTVIMDNWINQPGYPVVNVTLNGSQITLSQERFVYSNSTTSNITWYIPITYTTSQDNSKFLNTTPVAWIIPNESLTLNISNASWVIINNLQTGYYRVNYDSVLWAALTEALQQTNYSGIPEINRAQIVNDAFSLARAGHISYTQVFTITEFLTNETSYTVWYPALSGFNYLVKRVGLNSTLGSEIANHVLNLTNTLLTTVPITSTNSSNHIYTLKQVLAQTWACKLGSTNCTTEAVSLFEQYKNSSSRPDKNLRSIVYCYGLRHSTDISTDWEFLWTAFLNTSLSTEQVTILSALGCSENATILTSYLEKTLVDDTGIRSQDYASVFAAVYGRSDTGVDTALDFFINNYEAIISRYTSMNGVGSILKGIASQITTDAQVLKLQSLITSQVLNGTVLEAANTALTSAQNNLQWVSTYKSSILSYYGLEEESSSNSTSSSTTSSSSSTTSAPTTTGSSGAAVQGCISLSLVVWGVIFKTF